MICLFFLVMNFCGTWLCGMHYPTKSNSQKIDEIIPSGEQVQLAGWICRKEQASEYQILYLRDVSIIYQNISIQQSKMIIYDSNRKENYQIGNKVVCEGGLEYFESASNPGNFDRKFYYEKQKIYAYMWSERIQVTDKTVFWVRDSLSRLREAWSTYFLECAGEKTGGILCAMLLGGKAFMDAEVKELYQVNGIAHILAISGLHLSFIGHGFYQLIRRGSGSYLAGGSVGLLFMTLYMLMIGPSVSAVRAVVMFVLRVVADMTGRVYDAMTAVVLSAAVVIGWRPLSFYDGGFQLSFGAIIGVVFVCPLLEQFILQGKKPRGYRFLNSLLANLSIQMLTIPVLLYHYFEFPLYSILLNMIIVPLMSVVLLLALMGSAVGLCPFLTGGFCLRGCGWILTSYEWLCNLTLKLPHSRIVTGQPKLWGIGLYYGCLLLFLLVVFLSKKRLRIWIFSLAGIAGVMLILSCPFVQRKELEVTMLDIGQGDCIFVQEKEMSCLIDGGSSDVKNVGKYRIEPFLKFNGVRQLDYVFVSHGDGDHISGIEEMLERQQEGIEIACLVLPPEDVWDDNLRNLAKLAIKQGSKVVVMKAGDSISGNQIDITCLYPAEDTASEGVEIGNATSMVLDISYGALDILCTGDVEDNGEKELEKLINKQYDVLKVAHHGSKNSSSETFLAKVKPKLGLISAGVDNSYGHPHEETLNRFAQAGSSVLCTKECGAIRLYSDGNGLRVTGFKQEKILK